MEDPLPAPGCSARRRVVLLQKKIFFGYQAIFSYNWWRLAPHTATKCNDLLWVTGPDKVTPLTLRPQGVSLAVGCQAGPTIPLRLSLSEPNIVGRGLWVWCLSCGYKLRSVSQMETGAHGRHLSWRPGLNTCANNYSNICPETLRTASLLISGSLAWVCNATVWDTQVW
jgi:hypothetical protein